MTSSCSYPRSQSERGSLQRHWFSTNEMRLLWRHIASLFAIGKVHYVTSRKKTKHRLPFHQSPMGPIPVTSHASANEKAARKDHGQESANHSAQMWHMTSRRVRSKAQMFSSVKRNKRRWEEVRVQNKIDNLIFDEKKNKKKTIQI